MQEEICGLKAQLTQATQENSSEAVEYLHLHLAGLSDMVLMLQHNVKQQTYHCTELEDHVPWMYKVQGDLEKDLQQERAEVKTLKMKLTKMDNTRSPFYEVPVSVLLVPLAPPFLSHRQVWRSD